MEGFFVAVMFSLLAAGFGFMAGRLWESNKKDQSLSSGELSRLVEDSVRNVVEEEKTSNLLNPASEREQPTRE